MSQGEDPLAAYEVIRQYQWVVQALMMFMTAMFVMLFMTLQVLTRV